MLKWFVKWFENIGQKVKSFALASFVVEIIAGIVTGIIFISEDSDYLLLGLLIIILSPFAAWVSTYLIYAFGHLVENSDKLVKYAKLNHESAILSAKEPGTHSPKRRSSYMPEPLPEQPTTSESSASNLAEGSRDSEQYAAWAKGIASLSDHQLEQRIKMGSSSKPEFIRMCQEELNRRKNEPASSDSTHTWICYSCKKMRSESPCPYCGGE